MSDTLSETEACGLLARLFKGRGYAIARNVMFREYGVEFHIDGWDPKARVGFEFLTSEDEDHDDLSLEEYQTLSAVQQRGELSLFILDEVEPISAADLAEMANEFLDEVAAAKSPRRRPAAARKGVTLPAKKLPKKAAKKKASPKKKPSAKKPKMSTGKPAKAKKPVRKKRPRRK
jgi:hypothetical protein